MDCDLCGRGLSGLPYTCNRCGQNFCTKHRLPEEHDCVHLKIEKAERELKREEGQVEPWFKDGFRLSNVEDPSEKQPSEPPSHDPITTDDKYRAESPTEECSKCDTALFEHEAAGCPHCGEIYCGDHLTEHRPSCDERDPKSVESAKTVQEHYQKRTREKQQEQKTRSDELEERRRDRYSSPDVNPDGSLSEAKYEEDIEAIKSNDTNNTESTASGKILKVMMILSAVILLGYFTHLFIL